MSLEPWIVEESWEGDGYAGAVFYLPDETAVFVSDFKNEKMSDDEFQKALLIRDMIRDDWHARRAARAVPEGVG